MDPKHILDVMEKYGQTTVIRMAKELSHTQNLKNQLVPVLVKSSDGKIVLAIKMPGYAKYVNYGRRAGAKMPPIEPIMEWAKSRGLPQWRTSSGKYMSNESRAWLISRKIGRDGIKPIPFFDIFFDNVGELEKALGGAAAIDIASGLTILLQEQGIDAT